MIIDSKVSDLKQSTSPDNGKTSHKQWWERLPIPASWWMENNLPPPNSPPYRDRNSENLDDTWSRYNHQRRYDDNNPPPLPPSPRIQVPLALVVTIVIYLVGQLIGGIWWAATQQSNLQHEIQDRAKEESRLWDSIQAYRAEVGALRVDIARLGSNNNRKQKEEE